MEQKKLPALFGARLKQLREIKNITQTELAAKLEVTQQTVASWECGRTEPSITAIISLSEILDTSIQSMFDIVENPGNDRDNPEFIIIQRNAGKMSDVQFKKMYNLLKISFEDFDWETKAQRKGKK